MKKPNEAPLNEAIKAIVDQRLTELGIASDSVAHEYTSAGPLPAHTSARTFNTKCRSGAVLGAVKVNRIWKCSRRSWFDACSQRPSVRKSSVVDAPASEVDLAETFLRTAGFRSLRAG